MTDRLERLRGKIDEIISQHPDKEESRCGFVHLYGVAVTCAVLALKRGLDPELCSTAGMLHDIWAYKINPTNHAELGALEAEKMLRESGGYTDEEISAIKIAIFNHSNKQDIHDDLSELLKDADVLQHYLYNTDKPIHEKHIERLGSLRRELRLI